MYAYPPVTADFGGARVVAVEGTGPLGRAMWLRRQMRADAPDIVSQHYVATDALALSMFRRPLVLSVWGSDVLRDLARWPKRLLVARALRAAALVVSPAEHLTERLTGLGVKRDRVLTRQYGVDTTEYAPADDVTRPAPATAVCTRSMRPIYGNEDILRALPRVPIEAVGIVKFLGGGPLIGSLKDMAEQLGLGGRAEFVGGVEHKLLPHVLREADIYCSMSRSDGASLSLLEAMSCGLPSVVSDIPANREWIDEGRTGFLVPCGDVEHLAARLEHLARDPELRASMGAAARETVLARGDRRVNVPAIIDAVEKVARRA